MFNFHTALLKYNIHYGFPHRNIDSYSMGSCVRDAIIKVRFPVLKFLVLGRSKWFSVHTHGNSNHVLGGVQIPSGAQFRATIVWTKVPLN